MKKRLEELKRKETEESPGVTDLDIKQRLAKLQDRPYAEDKPHVFRPDTRSEQEKINDLLEQVNNEAALDLASDPVRDLEERLNKLRGVDGKPPQPGGSTVPLPDDEEEDDKKYVKKVSF